MSLIGKTLTWENAEKALNCRFLVLSQPSPMSTPVSRVDDDRVRSRTARNGPTLDINCRRSRAGIRSGPTPLPAPCPGQGQYVTVTF